MDPKTAERIRINRESAAMRAEFPGIDSATYAVGIEESDQGFVYSRELSEAEYNKLEG